MRGKASMDSRSPSIKRITPAYAGKSDLMGGFNVAQEDHPRLCGEKVLEVSRHMPLPGSPPPMRGKVQNDRAKRTKARITPAYAGKS